MKILFTSCGGAVVWWELKILVNSGRAWVGAGGGGGAVDSLWWLKMVTGSVLICYAWSLGFVEASSQVSDVREEDVHVDAVRYAFSVSEELVYH